MPQSAPPPPTAAAPPQKPAPPPQKAAPPPQKAQPPAQLAAAPPATPSGRFVVQVAAMRSASQAQAYWTRLVDKHPQLLGNLKLDVQRADLGNRGIFFRVRAASFDTKAKASELCTALKSRGTDCIVKDR